MPDAPRTSAAKSATPHRMAVPSSRLSKASSSEYRPSAHVSRTLCPRPSIGQAPPPRQNETAPGVYVTASTRAAVRCSPKVATLAAKEPSLGSGTPSVHSAACRSVGTSVSHMEPALTAIVCGLSQ